MTNRSNMPVSGFRMIVDAHSVPAVVPHEVCVMIQYDSSSSRVILEDVIPGGSLSVDGGEGEIGTRSANRKSIVKSHHDSTDAPYLRMDSTRGVVDEGEGRAGLVGRVDGPIRHTAEEEKEEEYSSSFDISSSLFPPPPPPLPREGIVTVMRALRTSATER